MKWLLVSVAVIGALLLVVVIVGALLPVDHVASVSARVSAPVDRVWSAITDVEDFPRWRPDVREVDAVRRDENATSWVEVGSTGPLPLEVVESRPPERLVLRIAGEDMPFGGTWTYQLAPVEGGTRMTITENGSVYNPFFRFVSRFVMGHEGTLRSYLGHLTADLGGEVDP